MSLIFSIYNYIDIHINIKESLNRFREYYTTITNRFFKFVIDSYILDHTQHVKCTSNDILTLHFINNNVVSTTNDLFGNKGVCMILISGEVVNSNLNPGTNTLIIF